MEREERKIYLNDLRKKMDEVVDLAYEIMDGPYGVILDIEDAADAMRLGASIIRSKALIFYPRDSNELLAPVGVGDKYINMAD
jgi:hypothetical protein